MITNHQRYRWTDRQTDGRHVHPCAKFLVYWIFICSFGENVHMHPYNKFKVCSFTHFGDMFEGVTNFISVT